jgi:hypothetical protein
MSSMPTFDHLRSAIGQDWRILDASSNLLPVKIVAVQLGRIMVDGLSDFSLLVELPMGNHASQGTYRLADSLGCAWTVFMSPAAPSGTGQARLQAAFNFSHAS